MHHFPPQMLNSYLIKGEKPSLSSRLFFMSLDRVTQQIKLGLQRRLLAQRLPRILRYLQGDTRRDFD